MQIFTIRGQFSSVFLFDHSVPEEQESWTSIGLFFVIAVCETSIKVISFSCEDLHFIELFKNELHKLGCSLLKHWDSFSLALLFKLSLNFLDIFYIMMVRDISLMYL